MNKWVETFLKAAITVFVGMICAGIWYTLKVVLTVEGRISNLEIVVNSTTEKTNAIYYKYVGSEIKETDSNSKMKRNIKEPL